MVWERNGPWSEVWRSWFEVSRASPATPIWPSWWQAMPKPNRSFGGSWAEVTASWRPIEQQAKGRLATARLLPPGEDEEGIVLDLLFASSGIESEVAATADLLEILPGLRVPVARTSHLIALKVLSRDDVRRPTDLADLRSLIDRASPADLQETERLLSLITERGYNRDRDLLPSLHQVHQALLKEKKDHEDQPPCS
jgi:hypothetical protein